MKTWYDGLYLENIRIFTIHGRLPILKEGQLRPYWASTSSNGLVNKMLQSASPEIKTGMETLLDGGTITVILTSRSYLNNLKKMKMQFGVCFWQVGILR